MLLGLVQAGAAADAQDLPTVAALEARVAAAEGSAPASSYEQIAYTRSGVAGSRTIVRAGDDVRQTDTFGPLTFAHGSFRRQAWHQNANGQTVLEQPYPGEAAPDTYHATVQRVTHPVDAFVIARLNAAGSGAKDYVDPASGRIVRREQIRPTETTVYSYDDFRSVGGYTTAWHWTVRDGHPENDAEYRVENLVARPISTTEIEVAPPRRALVEFPAGTTSVELPARLIGNKFIVRVTIAGRGLDFELDSGASGIVLDQSVVHDLGLREFATFARINSRASSWATSPSPISWPTG